ncbi:MAG TPA: hypothetical protein PKD40_10340, partial [Saprospiraceae bacterium]|nr:hypothetical protein [Saprospiraceae bacterium]
MQTYSETTQYIEKLETSLETNLDPAERIKLLSQLINSCLYTEIVKTQYYLEEQKKLFVQVDNPVYYLQYLLHSAALENNLYNHNFAEAIYQRALALAESQLEPIQITE